MTPLLHSNASRCKAMNDLTQATPDKFQKNDDIISNQKHQLQMTSGQNCSVAKNDNYFIQKFLTKDGNGNSPNSEKLPNN